MRVLYKKYTKEVIALAHLNAFATTNYIRTRKRKCALGERNFVYFSKHNIIIILA